MDYQRYFKPGQQLLLKALRDTEKNGRTELMSVFIVSLEEDYLLLSLPYGTGAVEQYPFNEGLKFEVTTESMGVGIRTTGHFRQRLIEGQFTLQLSSDLQIFQRRNSKRFDCKLGIRFSRAAKTLQTMREIWEKNIEVLHSPEVPLIFDGFKSSQVNISPDGIKLTIEPPGHQGELCLILVNLEDGQPPICAVAEIVWISMENKSAITAGMRFINILSEDQQRIETFIVRETKTAAAAH